MLFVPYVEFCLSTQGEMFRVSIMLTVAAVAVGVLPRAAAFAPGVSIAGLQRAKLVLRGRGAQAAVTRRTALGARMVATEPESATSDRPQPSPDFKFNMEDITSVCKRRGFIFQSSEIYQGLPG